MLGISYGELFLLIGATAALVGPKDLPRIARTIGRFAGRSIGYVQLARGQFDNVMQQSQARQVHKELQDTLAQIEAIRYEMRSVSFMNPGPMTRNFVDNALGASPQADSGNGALEKPAEAEKKTVDGIVKDNGFGTLEAINLHTQATSYAKLAEAAALKADAMKENRDNTQLDDESGLFTILPVSAESTGMLPNRKEKASGSDLVLEAMLEADVAHKARDFFSQTQNQIPLKQ